LKAIGTSNPAALGEAPPMQRTEPDSQLPD
jgi:hypothetical protein